MRLLLVLAAAGLALGACGEAPRAANEPRVTLKLSLPNDGGSVRADHVAVRGTVVPADAAVQVAGADAEVDGGEFVADIALQPGGNVIDITATAPGRRTAANAVRVVRDMRVEVPRLAGSEFEAASAELERLGLGASEQSRDSWLDRLLGGTAYVCATQPRAGALVQPRSTVTLETAGDC
ncbi:MAG TPA: PASTA domain-containing protein [Solirubrobacter sp.]|nr:PASTA domain-containing protein [Solirubrobacter sp.]